MTARTCIVGGCGHVGLPLGIALARAGHDVTLVDASEDRVRDVASGHLPFLEEGADSLLPGLLASGRLRATTSDAAIGESDVAILTIGTPVDEYLDPETGTFDRSLDLVLDRVRAGQLVVLRSTVFPGTTERVARRAEERGLSVDVAYCPERIAQGRALVELPSLPQLCAGVTPDATRRASELFASLGASIIEITPLEAELAKLFANAYRYLNFAISNQFYMIAQRFGADFHRIHAAATKDYPRLAGFAGAGFAGGPCLLKDTMQLAAFNHADFALGQAAMMVNEGLPAFVVERLASRRDLASQTVGILGMAFKGDSDDTRDSLAFKLRKILRLRCRRVLCTDPHVRAGDLASLETVLAESDVLVVGACHAEYRDLEPRQPVVDVFGFMRRARA
jgi:UDP-N-acetyl-D-mannosaminuronic acid dehydrogenase